MFHIRGDERGGVTVTLQSMTIENGNLPENASNDALRRGGGIYFHHYSGGWLPGSLILQDVNVRSNQASDGNGDSSLSSGGAGGAIYSIGTQVLNHSHVEYNRASHGKGGPSSGSGGGWGWNLGPGQPDLNY